MTDVVVGRLEFADAVTPWRDRVDVIPTGEVPPNPSPLLSSKSMALFVESARERYDVVIVDTPGVLSSSDALELGRLTDGVVLVATVGHSSRGQLVQAARALTGVPVPPVLGVVLDGVSESAQRAGGPSASKASTSSRPAGGRGVDAP